MKTSNVIVTMLVFVFIVAGFSANAQTIQKKDLIMTQENFYCPCIGIYISGTWTAHFTYYLDKKGKISRIHWNTLKSDFINDENGEKVKVIDTGNDNIGNGFWFMDNPTGANGDPDHIYYNVPDGWLDELMPDILPFDEGSYVEMNFKWMYNGVVFGGKFKTQLHINAKGEITVDNTVGEMYCRD